MAQIIGAVSDVEIVNREQDGKNITSAIFQLQTKSPSEYWTVKVTPAQLEEGLLEIIKKYENDKDSWSSKPIKINVRAKESSFNGQKFFNFILDSIPEQNEHKKSA